MSKLYIGAYGIPDDPDARKIYENYGDGLYILDFKEGTLQFETYQASENLSYLCRSQQPRSEQSPRQNLLYGTNEKGGVLGTITIFKDQRAIATVPSHGMSPCHLALAKERLFVANYRSGSWASYKIHGDELFFEQCVQHAGQGTHPTRQEGPHVHWCLWHEDVLWICDLGLDLVIAYRLIDDSWQEVKRIKVPDGSGPRSALAHDHKLYVTFELSNELAVIDQDSAEILAIVSTLPEDFTGDNLASELWLSADAKTLYVGNRGHNSIAHFDVTHSPKLMDSYSTKGETPRSFAVDPTGKWLIAANQDSSSLAIFKRNQASGELEFSRLVAFPHPYCVRFF